MKKQVKKRDSMFSVSELVKKAIDTVQEKPAIGDILEDYSSKDVNTNGAVASEALNNPIAESPKSEFIEEKEKVSPVFKPGLDYDRFLKPVRFSVKGKAIYVRSEFHFEIERIISLFGDKDKNLTITSYLNNILENHFEVYGNEIKRRKRIILNNSLKELK